MPANRKAFTLVELLVVISIIALLLSVLMPALGKARLQGRKIVCASYLKQWGLGIQFYANDNKGSYPPGWHSLPYLQKSMVQLLNKYFKPKDATIISCPVLHIPLPQRIFDPNNASSWYTQYCYWGGITQENVGAWWSGVPPQIKAIGLRKITDKPKEIVMSDKSFPTAYKRVLSVTNWNHKYGGKFIGNNNLYGDTHVEHVDFSKLKEIQCDGSYKMMR
jgi:prepilin-type N-terminal cleavage/methylation domain-containing protein